MTHTRIDSSSDAVPATTGDGRRVVIASGAGRYADPWHPYPQTSAQLADLLARAGFAVAVDEDLDAAMTRLEGIDLLVVNAGDPWRNAEPAAVPAESVEGFRRAVEAGIGILAMHTAPATMRDYPDWPGTVGAIWLPQISMHPPADETKIEVVDSSLAGTSSFRVFDERYCKLQPVGTSRTVATHVVEGVVYPAAWTRTVGSSRVAVDVLGHDQRSYESDGHQRLLFALALWASRAKG